jgi:hypothetical protein
MNRTVGIAVGVVFAVFASFVVVCNGFDWDLFLAFNEVDRRAWVLDRTPPLWSYQLCAGVTRVGDPQASGLSPLFLLVVLTGSFWGTKLHVIVCAAAGLYFTTRLLDLFAQCGGNDGHARRGSLTLAALFVTSNYFLWHLLLGHVNFASFYLALGIVFYTLKGYLQGLGRSDLLIGVLVTWQHYSGPFFHSMVYLLVPFFAAFGLYLAATSVPGFGLTAGLRPGARRRIAAAACFHALGLLLASYKLIAVWGYQSAFPRDASADREAIGLGQLFAYQVMPTRGPEWLIPVGFTGRFDLHEYSAFSLLPFVLLLLVLRGIVDRRRAPSGRSHPPALALGLFVSLYFAITCVLALGDFSAYAPFTLLNEKLLQNSVRIASRFGVGLTLSLALACTLLLRRLGGSALSPGVCGLLLLLQLLDIASFSWLLDPSHTRQLASLASGGRREMNELVMVQRGDVRLGHELETATASRMYPALRSGLGVINCWNPLERPSVLSDPPPGGTYRLISDRVGFPGLRCIEESHFTQNEIRIAASCPETVCLNIGSLNLRRPPPRVSFHPGHRRFCREPER